MISLYCGDCLNEMDKVADHSVDMIFTDMPYGTTNNAWDIRLPLDKLWEQYKRVLKTGGRYFYFPSSPSGLTSSIAIADGIVTSGYGINRCQSVS